MKSGIKSKENWTKRELVGSSSYASSRYRGSTPRINVKKPVKFMVNIFCRKLKAEGSVTLQNIFSSMADFRDVVSVMPCSPTIIKESRIFVAVRKRLIESEKSKNPS